MSSVEEESYVAIGIEVLDEKEGKRRRPGMYFRWCETAAALGAWHLREPIPGEKMKLGGGAATKTLCGLKAAWDIDSPMTYQMIVEERERPGHTCYGCKEAFLAMTDAAQEEGA